MDTIHFNSISLISADAFRFCIAEMFVLISIGIIGIIPSIG